ncbi:MAG: hypothetical protein QM626_02415 [Microbacterium sp.]|uniref:hypothetical protein n=1 Tax=Microbacterium sp. TaxID=51671 RepID=UPI0039E256F2
MDAALDAWKDFDVAMLGATAALAGLVIVAATINIAVIVKERSLTARVANAIAGLVLAICVCAVGLMPGLTGAAYGWTTLVLAAAVAVFSTSATIRVYQNRDPWNRMRWGKAVMAYLAPVVYGTGAVMLLAGSSVGLIVVAVGALAAIVTALLVSWIVLVEVLR